MQQRLKTGAENNLPDYTEFCLVFFFLKKYNFRTSGSFGIFFPNSGAKYCQLPILAIWGMFPLMVE